LDIQGKRALILGGYGLVGSAVCRELLARQPARLVVGSLRQSQAEEAVAELRHVFPKSSTEFIPAWGDVLLRAEWQALDGQEHPRDRVLGHPEQRRRLVADILHELDKEILESSLLYQLITGRWPQLGGQPADIVIDCMNTATAVAYQNVYSAARRLETKIEVGESTDWPTEVEQLLSALYVPQLVRHMQILYEAMREAGTQAYVKVGTSGTGGMGFNIPYTHGEERPSRVLLSKSAVAGAQTMLIFLLARTPGGPRVMKEIKPTAAIAWKEVAFGPIRAGGRDVSLFDCDPSNPVPVSDPASLAPQGDFGHATGDILESAYVDSGENGLFAAGEFTALTTLGQMAIVTPEEIAHNVVTEIEGGNTGRDVVAALDASVMGPSYRAATLRQAALNRLHQLEDEHGVDSVAFELLGPPRLSKLLFEAYLIQRVRPRLSEVLAAGPDALSSACEEIICQQAPLRQQMISIGIPILMADGQGLLRGPKIKSTDAEHGWVDLRPANMKAWQGRLSAVQAEIRRALDGDTSSRSDRLFHSSRSWKDDDSFDIGEVVGWIFNVEEAGSRGKG
jgi:NAD(P)-dependent dehydrogenase (short-subunit alcohol dehydrogenase family)